MDKKEDQDEFIYSESEELSVGESVGWTSKIVGVFPAFKSKNYRYYFAGQLVSLTGTWMQIVAQGWLVLQLTNSAFYLGVVTALGTLPSLLFSLFGGVIVDRFPKRKILTITQSISMILAFLLGILTVLGIIQLWQIALLAFLSGLVSAIDIPARQSFVIEMVKKENLSSAIALNSGMFNIARAVGPAVAGFLIVIVGTGFAFILNGVSYLAVLIALVAMRLAPYTSSKHSDPLTAIKEGLAYAFSHKVIKTFLLFTAVVSVFGWSYTTILPYIAKNTFQLDAAGLGTLYAASGLGALVAAIFISAFSKKIKPLKLILYGNILFSLSLILFSLTNNLLIALPLLFFTGMGLLMQFATINSTIQHMVDDRIRGRVFSLYALMFMGLSPLGNFQIGYISEHLGAGFAMQIGAVVVAAFGLYFYSILSSQPSEKGRLFYK